MKREKRVGVTLKSQAPRQTRAAGHFGEWVQGRLGPDGPVVLVTIACTAFGVTASPTGAPSGFSDAVLRRFAHDLGLPRAVWPQTTLNMPAGAGCGASTATLVALARFCGWAGPPQQLAKACLNAEGATDPVMFDAPDQMVWASRTAQSLRCLPAPPKADILGGFWGAPTPTDPTDTAFADVTDLVDHWQTACQAKDLGYAARIATCSAQRCADIRGGADPMADLARDLRALGWVRAHTGSARGLVFAPGTCPTHGHAALTEAGLTQTLCFETGAL